MMGTISLGARDVPRWNQLGGRDGVPNQGELGAPRDLAEANWRRKP
jgi:hypothetical protein